jgi:hypothetical protein
MVSFSAAAEEHLAAFILPALVPPHDDSAVRADE